MTTLSETLSGAALERVREPAQTFALGLLARLLTPTSRQRLSVLFLHRVLPEADPLQPDELHVAWFSEIMQLLAEHCAPVSLGEGLALLDRGQLPARAVCVTFDDGYADNLTVAAPIMAGYAVPATVFVASGFLDGQVMWNDRVIEAVRAAQDRALDLSDLGLGAHPLDTPAARRLAVQALLNELKYRPRAQREELTAEIARRYVPNLRSPMLSRAQVRALSDMGVEIGGHTVNHPILTGLSSAQARHEVGANKEDLEAITGEQVRFFAYPNGLPGRDFGSEHCGIVKQMGYQAALTTQSGVTGKETNRFLLPRFTPWDRTRPRFLLRLVWNMRSPVTGGSGSSA